MPDGVLCLLPALYSFVDSYILKKIRRYALHEAVFPAWQDF